MRLRLIPCMAYSTLWRENKSKKYSRRAYIKHISLELQSITSIITMLNLDLETGSTMATRISRLITIYRYRKQLYLHHTYICLFTRITVKNNGLIRVFSFVSIRKLALNTNFKTNSVRHVKPGSIEISSHIFTTV